MKLCLSSLVLAACLLVPDAAAAQAHEDHFRFTEGIRGITIGPIESSQHPGRGYGTPYSEALLDELVKLGANAIAITPFGRLWSLSSTEIALDFEAPYADNRLAVKRMIEQAHARGLAVIVVPHLWVETGGWRGELDPGSPERWAQYQASYRRFVLTWAKNAADFGADALSIGVECTSWSGRFGSHWKSLIAEIRNTFQGPLTYSSNWDEVENVLFWDQLDWIGINAFYPLASDNGASYAQYAERAQRVVGELAELSRIVERPVVLMEIGYTTRPNAAVEPWLWPDGMKAVEVDEWEQARALYALASAAASEPALRGFFVWRYYADLDDVSQEAIWGFSPHGKLAEPVLRHVFEQTWARDPAANAEPWLAPERRSRAFTWLEP